MLESKVNWVKSVKVVSYPNALTHPPHPHPTPLPLDKMAAISKTTFSNAFSWMKSFVFMIILLKFVSREGSSWQYRSICSSNVLAPNRRQAITWTNADPVHQRIYAALGGDELTCIIAMQSCNFNTSSPSQNRRQFTSDIFKCMAWLRTGDKPLAQPMMV